MRLSVGFLLRFFALAAVLFALWSFAGVGDAYGRAVLATANPFMSLLSGFRVTGATSSPTGLDVLIARAGEEAVLMPLQPREAFSGLIPFLALAGASSGVVLRRRLQAIAFGGAVLFVFHIGLALVGPYMTGLPQEGLPLVWIRRVNTLIDVFYGFYGLIGYAALPFLLWFWLVHRSTARGSEATL